MGIIDNYFYLNGIAINNTNSFSPIRINQLHRIPGAVCIGTYARIFVRHRVDAQKQSRKRRVIVPRAEVVKSCEQVRWTCEPSPAKSPTLRIKAKGVFFFACESERVFVGITMLIINIFQTPKIDNSGCEESAVQIACYVAVSMQNGLYLRS